MKKAALLFIFLSVLFAALHSHNESQMNVNVFGGLTRSWISGDWPDYIESLVDDGMFGSIYGMHIGVSLVNYDSDRLILLEPGVKIIQRGFQIDYGKQEFTDPTGAPIEKYNAYENIYRTYIDVFAKCKVRVANFSERFALFPYVGSGVSMLLSAPMYMDYGLPPHYETSYFDIPLMVGIDFLLYRHITLGVEYNRGLLKLFNNTMNTPDDTGFPPVDGFGITWQEYNNSINLSIGYLF